MMLLLPVIILLKSFTVMASSPLCTGNFCELQNMLFDWIRQNGGEVSEKVEFSTGSDPAWNIRGIFAIEDIEEGETILKLNKNLHVCRPNMCEVVVDIAEELRKGAASYWLPYLKSMEDHEADIPNIWTDEERGLFHGLYPQDWTRHTEWFEAVCEGRLDDPHTVRALVLVVARSHGLGDDSCMSPFYDALNHDNTLLNTFIDFEDGIMLIRASQRIGAGQQVFNTFGDQGVGRFVRDYGFVPARPHVWEFIGRDGKEYSFHLIENDHGFLDINPNPNGNDHQNDLQHYLAEITEHLHALLEYDPFQIENVSAMRESRVNLARSYRAEYVYGLQVARQALYSQLTGNSEM